jgi:hypothetical protein
MLADINPLMQLGLKMTFFAFFTFARMLRTPRLLFYLSSVFFSEIQYPWPPSYEDFYWQAKSPAV